MAKAMQTAKSSSRRVRRSASETRFRQAVIETALDMSRTGLSPGRSGNVSVRFEDGMLITPSGMPYDEIKPDDIVFVGTDGRRREGERKPSSEWQFHLAALAARKDRDAIVHTHSTNAVVLACRHEAIPAFHYMVAVAGGTEIPCVPYAVFGSPELADYVATGLADADACLMANHGQIAMGTSLDRALELATEVETLAAQYVGVLQLGKPKLLTKRQMNDVLERIKTYGQAAQDASPK